MSLDPHLVFALGQAFYTIVLVVTRSISTITRGPVEHLTNLLPDLLKNDIGDFVSREPLGVMCTLELAA